MFDFSSGGNFSANSSARFLLFNFASGSIIQLIKGYGFPDPATVRRCIATVHVPLTLGLLASPRHRSSWTHHEFRPEQQCRRRKRVRNPKQAPYQNPPELDGRGKNGCAKGAVRQKLIKYFLKHSN
jgi:hypothetical protein